MIGQELEDHIQYDYLYDNHFSDLKETELLTEQLSVIASMEPYMGKYFSAYNIRSKILKQTETEMKEMDNQIKKEIKDGIIADPNTPIDPGTGMPVEIAGGGDLGAPINEPDLEKQGKCN